MSENKLCRRVIIRNPQGLHARPAEMFARLASQFESTVEVIKDGYRVDAKSILHILTLGAEQGQELLIEVSGNDAQQALDVLAKLAERESFPNTKETQNTNEN